MKGEKQQVLDTNIKFDKIFKQENKFLTRISVYDNTAIVHLEKYSYDVRKPKNIRR